ncbi:MAG: N-acetylmuramoyl-L-alanine amidase [Bacteroidales bacterium]|nr:N-acetylmuramoyl-L-alanine amidase [Bacteroidales bacterium]
MKKLKYLVIHCTDTPEGREVSKKDIERWHLSPKPKGRGWKRLGYSDMIHIDGSIENLTPYDNDDYVQDSEKTWGATGVNAVSRHIVVVGGRTKDNRHIQFNFMEALQVHTLIQKCKEEIALHPDLLIAGHYHFSEYKTCPNFDVEALLLANGISEKNIYTNLKPTPFETINLDK